MRTCIDIGGTKVLIASVDDSGIITKSQKLPTPDSYDELMKLIATELKSFELDDSTIVVGAPGKIDRTTGTVEAFGNRDWTNTPIKADLEEATGKNVYIENDANLAGLGEYYALDPRPHQALYITISTGIGTGVVTDGKLDPDHLDSEGGHMLVEYNDELVIWEKAASGKSIVAKYGKRASELDDEEAWEDISHWFAIGIINLLAAYEPDTVIIGGGVGSHFDKYEQPLLTEIKRLLPNLIDLPPIVKASQPEEAVILGCYWQSKILDES